jgi:hypothetical protein
MTHQRVDCEPVTIGNLIPVVATVRPGAAVVCVAPVNVERVVIVFPPSVYSIVEEQGILPADVYSYHELRGPPFGVYHA